MCFSLLWGKKVLGGSECMSAEKKFSLIFLALQCNRWLRRQRTCLQQGDLDSTPRSGRCPGTSTNSPFFLKKFIYLAALCLSCDTWAQLPHSTWDLSSLTRDQSCVPCIGMQILNHWTTREVLHPSFFSGNGCAEKRASK